MTFKEDAVKNPSYKILVVDDEEAVRKLVSVLLSKRGHHCSEASDGVDALDKVAMNKFDAIITDIVMPRMDGITLTVELLKQTPALPVMVMSAYYNELSPVTAVAAGAREFITKPFSFTELNLRFQKMMSDYEISLEIMAKQKEVLFGTQRESSELQRRIENLKDQLHAGYPRFNR